MKAIRFIGPATVAAAAGSALAGGVINHGNASLQIGASSSLAGGVFNAPNGEGNLQLDGGPGSAATLFTGDQVQKNIWWYRPGNAVGGTIGSRIMSSLNTPTQTYSGDTATIAYTNFFQNVAFPNSDITFTIKLTDLPGTNTARFDTYVSIRNRGTSVLNMQLFHQLNANLQNSSGTNGVSNDLASFVGGDPTNQLFADSGTSNNEGRTMAFQGFGASRGANGQNRSTGMNAYFPTSSSSAGPITQLNNTSNGATNLNTPSAFGVAGALQFSLSIAPGATAYIHSAAAWGINGADAIPTPGAAGLLGLGGLAALRRRRAC